MVDGFNLVCPTCGKEVDLSAGLRPNENGQLICTGCGAEIPIPLAAPDDSPGDTTTTVAPADMATVVEPQHQVHPGGTDTIESALGDSACYVEKETIGKGGMGEIVLCVEQNVRREVAMKRLLPTAAGHARQRARFVQEAQVTGQLEHPNIVPIHELGRDEHGAIYFTMKLVKGRSLAEILNAARDGAETHSLGEMLQMFLKVCDGVAFAHSRGVVHRDLKPANIMVGDFGEVLVMDWGIARILGRDDVADDDADGTIIQSARHDTNMPALHTMAGAVMGSPQYMPPEQASGQIDKIDHRSDIYSLGAILYEILTLKRPFEGADARAIVTKVIEGDIQTPERRASGRDIPRELSAVAMKCLAKYRGKRYPSVPELQRDVSLYLEGRSVTAAPDTFAQAFVKLVKRNKPVSVSIAVAAVILSAVVSVAFVRVTGAMRRAISGEQKAVTAQQAQRATAMSASEQLARQAVRAAGEGRFAEADVRADAAVKVLPDGPWGHYALGVVAFEKKDFAGARSHLEEASRLDASHEPSRLLLGSVMAVSGDLSNLEKLVAHAAGSTDWRSLAATGDALMDAQKYPQARKAYQRAVELITGQAAVPENVRAEVKDNLARSIACVKMIGFYESIRTLPANQQARRLKAKFKEVYGPKLNITFKTENDSLFGVEMQWNPDVRWLDPLRDLPLRYLDCGQDPVSDLSPLKGMPLTRLVCDRTDVSDLSVLKGMPLRYLDIERTRVSDLSPLKGMPLTHLRCKFTSVTDMTPLKGMRLTDLNMWHCASLRGGLSALEGMPLVKLDLSECGSLRGDLASLKGMPLTSLKLHWCRSLEGDLSALKGMKLTSLDLTECKSLRGDLSALNGMKLTSLDLTECKSLRGDLSALKGMKLTSLTLTGCRGLEGDLSALRGMPLATLNLQRVNVSDLTPLKGMALQYLDLRDTHVSDLGPLAGMKLTSLSVRDCPVTSLRGLENMPLTHLCCLGAPVKDLGPLKGMLLKELHIGSTKVTDLTPLAGMNLQVFSFTPKNITKGVDIVRGMKSIRSIRFDTRYHIDPEEFWKKYDAGEYDQ